MRRTLKARAAALLLTLAAASPSFAQQAPAAEAPAPIARASIASLKDVTGALEDMGVQMPMDFKGMMEAMFPFIGPGGIDNAAPLGVIFLGGPNLTEQERAVIAFPVAEGKATKADMAKLDAQAVEGHPDIMRLGDQVNFRRTANHLLMYTGAAGALAKINPDVFAADYKQKGNLALISVDIAAARKLDPEGYKNFLNDMNTEAAADMVGKSAATLEGEKFGREMVTRFVESLERLTLAVAIENEELHLKTWLTGPHLEGKRAFAKPTFPADTFLQMHVVYPNEKAANWSADLVASMPDEAFTEDGERTPEQIQRERKLVTGLLKLFTGADAISVAGTMVKGKPVVYVVHQWTEDMDFAKELKDLVNAGLAHSMELKQDPGLTMDTYSVDGKTIQRVKLTNRKKPGEEMHIDFLQSGKTVYMTIAADEEKRVTGLAALPTQGETSALSVGAVDLGKAIAVAEEQDEMKQMPAEQRERMAKLFKDRQVKWVMQHSPEGKFIFVDMSIPTALIKDAVNMATQPPAEQ